MTNILLNGLIAFIIQKIYCEIRIDYVVKLSVATGVRPNNGVQV